MENPGKMLRRAKNSSRFVAASDTRRETVSTGEKAHPEPVHCSSHAGYTALMRSHDRIRTRHIAGKGGTNDA